MIEEFIMTRPRGGEADSVAPGLFVLSCDPTTSDIISGTHVNYFWRRRENRFECWRQTDVPKTR